MSLRAAAPLRNSGHGRPSVGCDRQARQRHVSERKAPLTTLQKIRLIEETIETIRPSLQRDGGDCELIDVDGNRVMVRLTGACVGCHLSSATIEGVQAKLVEAVGVPLVVIPVTQYH